MRKHNCGRLRRGDHRSNEERENDSDVIEEEHNNTVGSTNYGTRVSGPWVFGLCCKKDDILERRFLLTVEKHVTERPYFL